jgi:hypothetical protein
MKKDGDVEAALATDSENDALEESAATLTGEVEGIAAGVLGKDEVIDQVVETGEGSREVRVRTGGGGVEVGIGIGEEEVEVEATIEKEDDVVEVEARAQPNAKKEARVAALQVLRLVLRAVSLFANKMFKTIVM